MRGQLDPDYIRRLARYVDEKMRAISTRTHTVDSLRTAVLAALNIADEYYQLAAKYDSATRQVDTQLVECNRMLDQLLGQPQ